MKWSVGVGISLCIEYDDIEADSKAEAEKKLKELKGE